MAINRYSRGPIAADVQGEFIPLPIDLIDRQLQRQQTQYDTAKSFIGSAQEAVYGVKGMSPDSETLKQITSQYDEQIRKEVEKVGGDYGRLREFSDMLGQKVKKDIMSGHLGAIHNNFVKAQNRLEELNKLRNSGDIRESTYSKHLSEIQAFGGTVEDGKGGYTTMAFSPVTKAIEFGKIADDYGTEIADQYLKTGEKYINAKTASDLIERNLWNNQEVIANAEDEIWNTYGNLPADKKAIAVQAYIKKIAEDSGNKLAYRERFKPEDTSGKDTTLTPGIPIRYNVLGNKPITSTVTLGGENFTDIVNNLDNITSSAKTEAALVPETTMFISGTPLATSQTEENRKKKEEILLKGNKKAQEVAKKATQTTLVKTLADIYKVDITTDPVSGLKLLDKHLQDYNKSSTSTGVSMIQDPKLKSTIENVTLNSGIGYNVTAINLQEGKQLNGSADWRKMVNDHVAYQAGDKTKGFFLYSGTIETMGETYPKGSSVVTYVNPSEGKSIDVLLPLEVKENAPEFYEDRMMAAYRANNGLPGGMVTYKDHQFVVLDKKDSRGNYVIGHFINGEPAPLNY
jgi:hypothetical protein